jgi:ribosomal protein L24E
MAASTLSYADEGVEIPMVIQCQDYHGGTALKEGFGELPFVEGDGDINLGNNKSAPIKFELYVNPDSLSWTIMYELGDLHCVAAGGEGTFRPADIEPDGIKM